MGGLFLTEFDEVGHDELVQDWVPEVAPMGEIALVFLVKLHDVGRWLGATHGWAGDLVDAHFDKCGGEEGADRRVFDGTRRVAQKHIIVPLACSFV